MTIRKQVYFLLICFLFGSFLASADTLGFRAGLSVDSPDLLAGEPDYYLTPRLEYEPSLGNFDLYLGAEYAFHLTRFFPQFFFAEEKLAARLSLGSRSELRFGLKNENEILIDPEGDNGRGGGRAKPELGGALFLPPGDFSLALGLPLDYGSRRREEVLFGIDLSAAYTAPFRLGIEAVLSFIAAPAAVLDGAKFALSYAQDQFYGELAFKAEESFDCFSLRAEFDYRFNFFILNAALELGNLGAWDSVTLAPAVGIKYRF